MKEIGIASEICCRINWLDLDLANARRAEEGLIVSAHLKKLRTNDSGLVQREPSEADGLRAARDRGKYVGAAVSKNKRHEGAD